MPAFVQPNRYEEIKLAVHAAMLGGAVVCCAYNLAAWCYRGQTHNAVNAAVYFGLTLLEVEHVKHHAQ